MKLIAKYWRWWSLGLVFIMALYVRLYGLGHFPPGLTWDEAAIGYNGWAVWQIRRDEWLRFLPISFQSFGDFKAPLAIYGSGLLTHLLGGELSAFVVRLPFAVWGSITVLIWAFVVVSLLQVLSKQKTVNWLVVVVSSLLIAVSPWHLLFTRAAFESGAAFGVVCMGFGFWLQALRSKKHIWAWLSGGSFLLILSLYIYHSTKLTVPVLIAVFILWQWRWVIKNWRAGVVSDVLTLPLLLPLVYDSLWGQGLSRAGTLILFSDDSVSQKISTMFFNLVSHFSPNFLLLGSTPTLRHGTEFIGVLLPVTFFLALVGVISWKWQDKVQRQLSVISIVVLMVGLLPAVLGDSVPHSNRALLSLAGWIGLATLGGWWLQSWLSRISYGWFKTSKDKDGVGWKVILGTLILVHGFTWGLFWHDYQTAYLQRASFDFSAPIVELLPIAIDRQREVDKIVVSDVYGQPYIYMLFYTQLDPIQFRSGAAANFEFKKIEISDLALDRAWVLAVNRPDRVDELPWPQAEYVVTNSVTGQVEAALFLTSNL